MEDGSQGTSGHRPSAPGTVLLYIDNSNIFENAKRHSAQKKKYLADDVACRIDIGKLVSKAVRNREILVSRLYGSEPPAKDTVWAAIRRKQVLVETFERSKCTGKEKEVDSSLTADAVEDMIVKREEAGDFRSIILFSGDRDLSPFVKKARSYGYQVEIWSFNSSLYSTRTKASEGVTIKLIDDCFDDVTYTQVLWGKKKVPSERSIIAQVVLPDGLDKGKVLEQVVEKAGYVFRLPMNGKYFYLNGSTYIVLIPCITEIYTPPRRTNIQKSMDDQKPKEIYSFTKDIQPFIFELQKHFPFCEKFTTWLNFLYEAYKQSNPSVIISRTCFEQLQVSEDEESELLEDDTNDFYDNHHEDVSSVDDDGFVLLPVKKKARSSRQYSTPCPHKFWCKYGSKCHYTHRDEERAFFKVQPDPGKRRLYKIKFCTSKTHKYSNKPYLCAYAHSMEESRCLCCREKGSGKHWMDQCPLNQKH